jgi:hypothetical protein
MKKSTQISRVAQGFCGVALISVSLTVGLTGMKLNIDNGLKTGVEAAIIFASADAARMILPLVCGLIGWTRQMKMVAVICVAASLFCAVTAFMSGADQHQVEKQAGADRYAAAQTDVKTAQDRVNSLDAQVLKEGKDRGCGPACKALKQEAERARSELSAAKAKAETAKPVAISGGETLESRVKALLLLLIVEATVWLTIPAMICLRAAFQPSSSKAQKRGKIKRRKASVVSRKPAKITEAKAAKVTKSGKIDLRTKQGRAIKLVTKPRLVAVS